MRTIPARHSARFIGLAVAAAIVLVPGCDDDDGGSNPDRDQAITAAQDLYKTSKEAGANFDRGLCLSEELPDLPDWVADIAHDPRENVDDDPANQCQRFQNGEAHHFVELTPQGELIRAE